MGVDYKEYYKNRKKPLEFEDADCFSDIYMCGGGRPVKIVYDCVSDVRNDKATEFYLSFLKKILNSKKFKIQSKGTSKIFTLDTREMNDTKALVYLTSFRYLDEFPEIVREFFKGKKRSLKDNFLFFQKIHAKHCENGDLNLDGHGLIYHYGSQKSFKPVSLDRFKKNLNNNKINSVFGHFDLTY